VLIAVVLLLGYCGSCAVDAYYGYASWQPLGHEEDEGGLDVLT
jgi:hypothetical protein